MSNTNNFVDYVSSTISLDALEKITDEIDQDVAECNLVMGQIRKVFDSLPSSISQTDSGPSGMGFDEELSNFLDSDMPDLLLTDLSTEDQFSGNLDDVVATMKNYTELMEKSYQDPGSKMVAPDKCLSDLELEENAYSLHELGKRLMNIKFSQREEVNKRNPELEGKLTQLCEDVNNFTQMVQAKTRLTEANSNWVELQQDNRALQYNELVTKLLSGINEVTYLLQNKNFI